MQQRSQGVVDMLSLWTYIASEFPDVYAINTPFWPPYAKKDIDALPLTVRRQFRFSLSDLESEDQERLTQLAHFLSEGTHGDADPDGDVAAQYLQSTRATYEEHAEDYRKAVVKHTPLDTKLVEFSRLISPHGKIIDMGCGPGHDILRFQQQRKVVVGLDVSFAMTQLAQEITSAPVYQMDISSLTFPDQTFEGIWCVATLLHLPRKAVSSTLQGFNRILQPSGYLYISVKQGTGSCLIRREKTGGSPRLFTYFSKEEMEQFLAEASFDVCEMVRFVTYRKNIGWDAWINILARKRAG